MSNVYSAKGLTGKSTRKMQGSKATHVMLGVELKANFALKASRINDRTISGKRIGAMVLQKDAAGSTMLKPMVATAGLQTSTWLTVPDASAVIVTPI
ncbi:acetyl-CoA acetyltransferase [Lelliottia phage phD2B]|uniref:Uncharacterized protein n=1 Tax=Lelliottia phage phD2B TaxID=1542498 RepID=A0A088FT79_9CAUD|nr:acetyl-CoA acetyltransferase [Lelliottia phage phD2B]AIM51270.1 hypothetical protein phD2B_0044 [Lelliottia phage phD2B]